MPCRSCDLERPCGLGTHTDRSVRQRRAALGPGHGHMLAELAGPAGAEGVVGGGTARKSASPCIGPWAGSRLGATRRFGAYAVVRSRKSPSHDGGPGASDPKNAPQLEPLAKLPPGRRTESSSPEPATQHASVTSIDAPDRGLDASVCRTTHAKRPAARGDRRGSCSARGCAYVRFKSRRPDSWHSRCGPYGRTVATPDPSPSRLAHPRKVQ